MPGTRPVSSMRRTPSSCQAAAPPLAWPVTVFWETTSSGLPGVRSSASWSRSCRSASLGSFMSVEVSCLETTPMSSAVRPWRSSAVSERPRGRERAEAGGRDRACAGRRRSCPRRRARRGPAGRARARRRRATTSCAPPPWASTKPARRMSLARARLVRREAHRLERLRCDAVAPMSAKPIMPSGVRSSKPPASTASAFPRDDLVVRDLERHRRGRARADRVDHRAVGAEVGLDRVRGDDVARATPARGRSARSARAGGRAAAAAARPSRPCPRPACWRPWPGGRRRAAPRGVEAGVGEGLDGARRGSRAPSGRRWRSGRSGTPKRARSRPVGSWPATRRVCATIRGTRICVR